MRNAGHYLVRIDGTWYLGDLVNITEGSKIIGQELQLNTPMVNDAFDHELDEVEAWVPVSFDSNTLNFKELPISVTLI